MNTSKELVLYIGGEADGHTYLDTGLAYVPSPTSRYYPIELYKRETIITPDKEFVFYIKQDMDMTQAIERLIDSYIR